MTNVLILGANGQKQPFKGRDVSLNGLSDLIVKLALTPGMETRHSIGVSRA